MSPKICLLLLLGLGIAPTALSAENFTCETFDGGQFTAEQWPIFIVTSRSEKDLSQSLQCASLIGTLETTRWLIDFAWPSGQSIKGIAIRSLLQSDYMKRHSTVLEKPIPNAPIMVLVDSNFQILWSSATFPNETHWQSALEIFQNVRKP